MTEQNTNVEDVNINDLDNGNNQESNQNTDDLLNNSLDNNQDDNTNDRDDNNNDDNGDNSQNENSDDKSGDDSNDQNQPSKRVNRNKKRFDRVSGERDSLAERLSKYENTDGTPVNQQDQNTQQKSDGAPNPDDFEHGINDINYITAISEYHGAQGYQKAKTKDQEQTQQNQEAQNIQDAEFKYNNNLDTAEKKYRDFNEVISKNKVDLDTRTVMVIKNHDLGAEMTYAILKNKDLSSAMSNASPDERLLMVGSLAAKLTPAQQKKGKKKTDFPDPMGAVESDRINNTREYKEGGTQSDFDAAHPFSDLQEM
jgi:hypothetical protein